MKRRGFVAGLTSWAALSLTARGQDPGKPVIGFLRSATAAGSTHLVAAFRQGLKEAGFVEAQNVMIEYRYADNRRDQLPSLATDLIRRQVAVIVGNNASAVAAKAATRTVPIIFAIGSDPIGRGLVTALNRPDGNITGVVFFSGNLAAKRLQLLRQLVPKATTIAMLVNPDNPEEVAERRNVHGTAQSIGQHLIFLDVTSASDIESAFASAVQRGARALIVSTGPFMNSHREGLVALAARHALPVSYPLREFVDAGGLMSYGASITEAYRQVGRYAGRILKGEKPADLPVMQSDKIEFVINLTTAKALGLEIHPQLLATADEVIE
jgi:putative ABC transport system substrate-binding protein